MKSRLVKLTTTSDVTIKSVMKQMGEASDRILFIVSEDRRLRGTVTDGDVRRWILKEGSLAERVSRVYNKKPRYVQEGYDIAKVKKIMIEKRIEALPVVDDKLRLIDVLLWREIFSETYRSKSTALNLPVLVMAGGKGARMDPFTRILPKPLIPLGDKPVIEHILDNFAGHGCRRFFVTLNYKGKMIKSYFDNADRKRSIRYIWEDEPYGTAGGIRMACEHIKGEHLFVSNCDILVRADYSDILKFHLENKSDITIVGSMKHFTVPYGVLDVKNQGLLHGIIEKPEYDYLVNTGLYLIKKDIAKHTPIRSRCDFPDLITQVKKAGGKINVYPIGQHSWVDVGQWQEYTKAMNLWGMNNPTGDIESVWQRSGGGVEV